MTECLNCGEDFDNKWSFDENRFKFKLYTKICFQCLSENFSIYKSQRYILPNTKPVEKKKDELKLVHLNYGKYTFKIYQRIREAKISKGKYVINENNINNFTPEMIDLIIKYMTELSLSNFKTRAMRNVDTNNIYTHSYQDCGMTLKNFLSINSSNVPQEAIATGKTWTLLKKKENRQEAIHVNAMLDWAKKKNEIIIVSFPDNKPKVDFYIFLPYFENESKRNQFYNNMKQKWTVEATKLSATKEKAKYEKFNTLYYSKYKFTNENNKLLKVNHFRVKQNPNDVYLLYLPIRFYLWENILPGLKKDFFCQDSDTNCKVVNKKILNMLPNIPFKNNDFMLSKTLFDNQNYEPNPFNTEIIKSNTQNKKKSQTFKKQKDTKKKNNSSQKSKENDDELSFTVENLEVPNDVLQKNVFDFSSQKNSQTSQIRDFSDVLLYERQSQNNLKTLQKNSQTLQNDSQTSQKNSQKKKRGRRKGEGNTVYLNFNNDSDVDFRNKNKSTKKTKKNNSTKNTKKNKSTQRKVKQQVNPDGDYDSDNTPL